MTTKQWEKYRGLGNGARSVYRAARMSGLSHKHAWKRATEKPEEPRKVARMTAAVHPLGA